MQHESGRQIEKRGEKVAERVRQAQGEEDQMGRMNDGKMMREMRGARGGSRKAELDPLKTNTLITTLHGKPRSCALT